MDGDIHRRKYASQGKKVKKHFFFFSFFFFFFFSPFLCFFWEKIIKISRVGRVTRVGWVTPIKHLFLLDLIDVAHDQRLLNDIICGKGYDPLQRINHLICITFKHSD